MQDYLFVHMEHCLRICHYLNSFTATDRMFSFLCFHCYVMGGGGLLHIFWKSTASPDQITGEEAAETTDHKYKQMWNNKSSNIKQHINQTEWNVDAGRGSGLWSSGCFVGSDLLKQWFAHWSESDLDIVFDKNTVFSAFCSKYIYFLIARKVFIK